MSLFPWVHSFNQWNLGIACRGWCLQCFHVRFSYVCVTRELRARLGWLSFFCICNSVTACNSKLRDASQSGVRVNNSVWGTLGPHPHPLMTKYLCLCQMNWNIGARGNKQNIIHTVRKRFPNAYTQLYTVYTRITPRDESCDFWGWKVTNHPVTYRINGLLYPLNETTAAPSSP